MKYRNVSSLGALDFPLVGRVVEPGEIIDVPDAQAHLVNGQDSVWEPVITDSEEEE